MSRPLLYSLLLLLASSLIDGRSSSQSCSQNSPGSAVSPSVRPQSPSVAQQRLGQLLEEARYFSGIIMSGAASCSITHSLVLPLDVIKMRMQTNAAAAAEGFFGVAANIFKEAPGPHLLRARTFFKGLPPTAIGYFLQGGAKFGGFAFFKHEGFAQLFERGGQELVEKFRVPVTIAAAAAAELAATVLLTPLEVVKLRVQQDPALAAKGMWKTFTHIVQHEGKSQLYKGFQPLAMRQLPYTITKLVTYDLFSDLMNRIAVDHEYLKPYIPIAAGLLAGAAAALVSQPGDLLLTRMCGSPTASINTNVAECVIATGFREQFQYLASLGFGAWAGLAPRLAQISVMTSIQFSAYDSLRHVLGVAGPLPQPSPVTNS